MRRRGTDKATLLLRSSRLISLTAAGMGHGNNTLSGRESRLSSRWKMIRRDTIRGRGGPCTHAGALHAVKLTRLARRMRTAGRAIHEYDVPGHVSGGSLMQRAQPRRVSAAQKGNVLGQEVWNQQSMLDDTDLGFSGTKPRRAYECAPWFGLKFAARGRSPSSMQGLHSQERVLVWSALPRGLWDV